jgi:TolB-like protein/Tfp pilus assembly protein PilF
MSESSSYQRFFAELKRRRVFRVAAVYGGAAFVLLQVADLLQEGLQLPQIFLTVSTWLALAGFPVALFLAWVYDRTPQGLVRTPEAAPNELDEIVAQPPGRRWPIGIAAAIGTALLLVSSWWMLGRPEAPRGERGDYTSVAVLPFENMSGNEEDAYFADGLSEELLNALARVDGLQVAGRTSSFALRDANLDLRTIGDTLGVETVLEGSVRRSGGRVRVTAQLIDAENGFHLWSQDWDRELTAENVFEIQDEIAGAVAAAMASGEEPVANAALGRSRDLVPASVRTSDLDAYELYLAGQHHWAPRRPEGLREAVRLFEEALELDSMYAPAWVGLAAVYQALPWYTDYPTDVAAEKSKQAGLRALELDPDNAEALYTLAVTIFQYDLEWTEAARLFERAIELDPQYSQGLTWYCWFLLNVGHREESIPWCGRAVELDPLRVQTLAQHGDNLIIAGRYEEGLRMLARALAVRPDFGWPRLETAIGLALLGRLDEAGEQLRIYALDGGLPGGEAAASTVIAGVRDSALRDEAVSVVRDWITHDEHQTWLLVTWLALLDDRETALGVIENMIERESNGRSSIDALLVTDYLRGEPRFEAAVASLGIPDPPPDVAAVPW